MTRLQKLQETAYQLRNGLLQLLHIDVVALALGLRDLLSDLGRSRATRDSRGNHCSYASVNRTGKRNGEKVRRFATGPRNLIPDENLDGPCVAGMSLVAALPSAGEQHLLRSNRSGPSNTSDTHHRAFFRKRFTTGANMAGDKEDAQLDSELEAMGKEFDKVRSRAHLLPRV